MPARNRLANISLTLIVCLTNEMEKLTAFVSRFEGEKSSSSEDIVVYSGKESNRSPVFSSSHAFNIANILGKETGSKYKSEVEGEQDTNVAEASKLAHTA
jgi:hypothetical protein